MATAWQDRFIPLANINNGNELQNGDDILAEHINAAIENGAYAKKVTDQLTTQYSNMDDRVTTLENKKFYTHNIAIACTSASSSQTLTNWTFVRFDAQFTIVSPSSLSFSNDYSRVFSNVPTNVNLQASGYVTLVDTSTGTIYTTAIITSIRFQPSRIIIAGFLFDTNSSNKVVALAVSYNTNVTNIGSTTTITDNYLAMN